MMKDYLVKALACNEHVRIYICSSTHMVEEARKRFDLWPTSAAAPVSYTHLQLRGNLGLRYFRYDLCFGGGARDYAAGRGGQ